MPLEFTLPTLVAKRKKVAKPADPQLHEHLPHTSTFDDTSEDGRRRNRPRVTEHAAIPETHPADRDTMAAADMVSGFTYLLGDPGDDEPPEDESSTEARTGIRVKIRRRYLATENPMTAWKPFRDDYLRELLRLDGVGGLIDTCIHCSTGAEASYRCSDNQCFGLGLVCAACCATFHAAQPFHFIEHWNGTFFEHCTLREIGLVVQLGHPAGIRCPAPSQTTQDFVVIHTNGIHTVNLHFCGCADSASFHAQLIRSSLWPSTPSQPRTAITLSLLRLIHKLNCAGKLPTWDAWKALEALTLDRCPEFAPPDRYKVLLRVLRQFRHVMMCKRAGRGNDVTGISGTAQGELAVECPACPHPGRNLMDNWQSEPKKFLYRLFLALDANFRLRNSMVSSTEHDPSLADGRAYFIPARPYMEHIKNFVNEDEMAACSGFQAMFLANLKNVKGLRTTGVVGITCSRHGVWRANGIGDLQRGERYCNIDAVFASATRRVGDDLEIVLSYDIVCLWIVHLFKRLAQLPGELRITFTKDTVIFCIPKFHLWAHRPKKHAKYSFNYTPGVGRTHGETIEENWSDSNRAASQTKQMGPGARQDTLDDVFSFHNLRTIDSFGRVLSMRLADAIKEARTHRGDFTRFNAGMIAHCDQKVVDGWLADLLAWEKNFDLRCPYEVRQTSSKTLREVQLDLEKEEHDRMTGSTGVVHENSLSVFISMGMNIEATQRSLAWEVKARAAGTTYQELNIQKQRNTIKRQIQKFRTVQQAVMPNVREYLTPEQQQHLDDPASILAEETKLFFPSELKDPDRILVRACVPGLVDAEIRVREAECRQALEGIRQGLRTRSAGVLFSVRNVTGQNPTTRAEGVHKKIQVNIKLFTLQYRWARNALFRLRMHGMWEDELQVLKDDDVRGMTERQMSAEEAADAQRLGDAGLINELMAVGPSSAADAVVTPGEGRRRPSWIWSSYATPAESDARRAEEGDATIFEALNIEWCKARARMLRFEEEVELVIEEMRRTVAYGRWKASWWRSREPIAGISAEESGGICAFAEISAAHEESRASRWESTWSALVSLGKDLLAGLPVTTVVELVVEEEEAEGDVEDMSAE